MDELQRPLNTDWSLVEKLARPLMAGVTELH